MCMCVCVLSVVLSLHVKQVREDIANVQKTALSLKVYLKGTENNKYTDVLHADLKKLVPQSAGILKMLEHLVVMPPEEEDGEVNLRGDARGGHHSRMRAPGSSDGRAEDAPEGSDPSPPRQPWRKHERERLRRALLRFGLGRWRAVHEASRVEGRAALDVRLACFDFARAVAERARDARVKTYLAARLADAVRGELPRRTHSPRAPQPRPRARSRRRHPRRHRSLVRHALLHRGQAL